MSVKFEDFTLVVKDITGGNKKYVSTEYLSEGKYPIIDQGEKFIGGYINDEEVVKRDKDIVIFGDHTKVLKYVDFDFCLGADGVKVLQPNDKLTSKFLYYFLHTIELPNVGYSRHFKFLKETKIPLPPLETQKAITEKLDKADALRKKDHELLKQYDELAQSIFIEMFGDPVQNEKGWDLINFEEVLKLKRGYDLPVQDRNQNGNIPVYGSNGILDYHTISKTNKPCIVTGRSGTIGKVHRTEQNCWPLNTTLYSYEIYDNNITYLEYLLNNLRIDRFAHGAGVPTLDRKIVHKEFIPNIKVELQNQFAEKIKNIEAQKELVKKQAEASENLFQALLQESFSFT